MIIDRSEIVCTYCGREIDFDEEICDCGKGIGYASDLDSDYCYEDVNCIDNILEDKRRRSGRYSSK